MKLNYKTKKVILSLIISTSIYSCATPTTTAPESVTAYAKPSADASASAGSQLDSNYKYMYPSVAPSASASAAPSAAFMPLPSASAAPAVNSSSSPTDTTGATSTIPNSMLKMPIVEDEKTKDNFFENYGFNPFVETSQDNLSTFGIDVDTASYTWMRKSLQNNINVYPSSVRVEEYINFFDYNYPQPKDKKLDVYTDLVNSRLGDKVNKILRIGIQGKSISAENRKSVNLTFVIDVSGSMRQENRLTLVKNSLKILVNELNQNDKVGIVVYGTTAKIVLNPTSADQKNIINSAIDQLVIEGSTNTEAGLSLGYSLAEKSFNSNSNNRIVLCSDGVANLGTTDPEILLEKIKKQSESGISLSTIGFGMGNYNDVMMEKLADKGDGNYSYVDTLNEATRIFRKDLIGTLQTIAKDAKVQVEFYPSKVKSYRLLGYENRDVADNDFRNDSVDAGEIGSNHSVTALYEVVLQDQVTSGKLANVNFRFQDVEQNNTVFEMDKPVYLEDLVSDFDKSSDSFKLSVAVTEFAEILRGGYWGKESSYDKVISLALDLNNRMDSEKLSEFITLVQKAKDLNQ
jgi:Ca-activated chloride channel family protein